jgi:hypothetical protein
MNYTIIETSAYANEGYVFAKKSNPEIMVKCMDIALLPLYDCVPEPQPEPEPEQEVEDNGESSDTF